ncbi:MAG: AmmeMemoRadiSam system protein B [Phycisphaerales bacterium]
MAFNESSITVRPAAIAGRFYPADPEELRAVVQGHLAAGEAGPPDFGPVRAVIAPHAGYPFSGPVAGSAFRAWADSREDAVRIVIVGPSHFVPFSGLATVSVDAFETPLGPVAVDREAISRLGSIDGVREFDAAHIDEHAIETHLPFLQVAFEKPPRIVPVLFGEATADLVARAIRSLWDQRTLVSISSDLSHFLNYDEARQVDRETADLIERVRPESIHSRRACGSTAIQGLLEIVREERLRVQCVDLRNSGATAGPRDRVVGYGAFLIG